MTPEATLLALELNGVGEVVGVDSWCRRARELGESAAVLWCPDTGTVEVVAARPRQEPDGFPGSSPPDIHTLSEIVGKSADLVCPNSINRALKN